LVSSAAVVTTGKTAEVLSAATDVQNLRRSMAVSM
jgi:hypothetical protein